MRKPLAYQEIDGVKKEISAEYVLNPKSEIENPKSRSASFQIAGYDTSRPLVIDLESEFGNLYLAMSSMTIRRALAMILIPQRK